MSGESIVTSGSFVVVAASDAVADGVWSTSAKTTIAAAFPSAEADYALIDFKFVVTSGVPTDGGRVELYFRPSDGTDQSPDPSAYANNPPHYMGRFVMNDELGAYYVFQTPNLDKNGTYTWKNMDGGVTLTGTLYARMRAFNTVP